MDTFSKSLTYENDCSDFSVNFAMTQYNNKWLEYVVYLVIVIPIDFSITEHLAVSILLCTVFGPTKSSLKYAIDGKSRITVY